MRRLIEIGKVVGLIIGAVFLLFATSLLLMLYGGEAFEMEEIDANAPLKIEQEELSPLEIFFFCITFLIFFLVVEVLEKERNKNETKN